MFSKSSIFKNVGQFSEFLTFQKMLDLERLYYPDHLTENGGGGGGGGGGFTRKILSTWLSSKVSLKTGHLFRKITSRRV